MSVEGTYQVKVKTPVGEQEGTLTLAVEGQALSGSLTNPRGSSDFTGGEVNGNEVHFTTKIKTPMGRLKGQVTGKVNGDTFTGVARLPLGTAQIEGRRSQ
jgi:carbon-monoxide dehydrogenase large subunit